MDVVPFFLGFVCCFKLLNFDELKPIGNIAQLILVIIDFLTLKYTNQFIENKNAFSFQLWFYLYLALIILYKPIRFRVFDNINHEVEYFVVGYGCAYLIQVILVFIVVFTEYPSPPAELVIAILGCILSAIITLMLILFETKN